MTTLTAYIDGIGLLGPGLIDWPSSQPILTGQHLYHSQKTILPPPELLASAERRRSGAAVKLTLAVGLEAVTAAGVDATTLPSVFSASGGDGDNCHAICEMLASDDRQISPTRFHNSVHNAASGYWSIATGAMTPASVLSGYDASFGAGLLEAMTQVVIDNTSTILLASDTRYPEPLNSARPISDALGISLVLSPVQTTQSLAKITISLSDAEANQMNNAELEQLRLSIPAGRGLPLLQAIAIQQSTHVVLDYLGNTRIAVDFTPC
ncbi:hypothetical protein LCGC14_0849110 [marine sediment metagenome]|uniref:Beta-ketoacyl synthase-like N-terminal domain-containing protein n=1 Tax=marine sediment metagenome TaxID=412755 RepID=A0A0F9PAU6_9ZZZZ|nr:3-oxoacyl-ACP synthase [Methylophaga sp.]